LWTREGSLPCSQEAPPPHYWYDMIYLTAIG